MPSLVVGTVSHTRRTPLRHAFEYRQYQWLVDLDAVPAPRWPLSLLARFEAADHLDGGRCGGGIRGDLERFLSRRGVQLEANDRVLMLANARVLGHVFDPLTVFWILAPHPSHPSPLVEAAKTAPVKAVVFEVHNTYGERHAYLLDVDDAGRATTDKEFYVSPFNDVTGTYAVRLRLDAERVSVTVGLDRAGERVLTATTSGVPEPATTAALLRTSARHLLMTQRVTALIRFHGIRLWLRRLPVLPRPRHSLEAVR